MDKSLRKMGPDHITMMIHSPRPQRAANQPDGRFFRGNLEARRALADAYKAGKLRVIGASNFMKEKKNSFMLSL